MEYRWLNKQKNERVIVFFNGWGMDECVISHLKFSNNDVIMFYDYNSLSTNFDFSALNKYTEIFTIAWSMGVMIASIFNIPSLKKIAINGTFDPIDNDFGIPNRIYDLTIRGFNEKSCTKFINNMFQEHCPTLNINRTLENQRKELIALKEYSSNVNYKYSKILISDNDKIIPTKNQCKYWNIEPNIKSGHCPFLLFNSWDELL